MISVNNLSIRFGGFELFSGIGFMINKRDRIGLVGKNGAGKSTLLKVINGEVSPSEGTVSLPSDVSIGYLPQQMILKDADRNIFEETREAFKELALIQHEIEEINHRIGEIHDYTSDEYAKLVDRLTHLSEHLNITGADNIDQEIEKVLKGLGFLRSDWELLNHQ